MTNNLSFLDTFDIGNNNPVINQPIDINFNPIAKLQNLNIGPVIKS